MNILSRLAGAFRRSADDDLERRSVEPSWDHLAAMTGYGGAIDPRRAEGLSAVVGCVNAISTALASLPVRVYRRSDAGRIELEDHPLARLVAEGPNRHQAWPDFAEWYVASTLLRGNGLAEIVRDGRGRLAELRPIPYANATASLLRSGRLVYDVSDLIDIFGGAGRTRRLLDDQVLHLRDRSDDGLMGRSRLSRAAAAVSMARAVQTFSRRTFENSVRPSIAITSANPLSKEAYTELMRRLMATNAGLWNAGMPIVVDNGGRVSRLDMSLEDVELLANKRFGIEEIARIYGVPPPIVGDLSHGTFTNSETLIRFFAQSTLSAWARKLEALFARELLSAEERPTHAVEIDLSGLLRGDPETRWKSHEIAVKSRVLTPNEIRETEGWGPREGGDGFPEATA